MISLSTVSMSTGEQSTLYTSKVRRYTEVSKRTDRLTRHMHLLLAKHTSRQNSQLLCQWIMSACELRPHSVSMCNVCRWIGLPHAVSKGNRKVDGCGASAFTFNKERIQVY